MALHPTLSKENLQYSVTKYLQDNFATDTGILTRYSKMYKDPGEEAKDVGHDVNNWVRVHFDGVRHIQGLGNAVVSIYVFSRGDQTDDASTLLARTRDLISDYLIDTDPDGNGIKTIPLLDKTDGTVVSNMVVTIGFEGEEEEANDHTLYTYIPVTLKYATV